MANATTGRGNGLAGLRVLVPRAPAQADELSSRIRARGGEPIEAPVLLIEPGEPRELDAAVRELVAGSFAMVCFTSPNGVAALALALRTAGAPPEALRSVPVVACVGPGTARALERELGLTPDLVPPVATTAALGEAVPAGRGTVLLPRADIASPVLPQLLTAKGYEPVDVVAYRTGRPDALPDDVLAGLRTGSIDLLAVASPSTARNLLALLGEIVPRAGLVSIGPVTTSACEKLGLKVVEEADPHTLDGLVEALTRAAASRATSG